MISPFLNPSSPVDHRRSPGSQEDGEPEAGGGQSDDDPRAKTQRQEVASAKGLFVAGAAVAPGPGRELALVRSMTRAPGRSRGAGHLDAVGLGGRGIPMEPTLLR